MAHGRPWYQRNGGEFILGTVHMDLETRGAYSLILDLLNDRDRPIPDEPRFIAGVLNCSVRKWTAIRETLLADGKLILNDKGELTNPRFERENADRHSARERSVEAGRAGGKKSAAMRAAGQEEFDLDSDVSASKTPRKRAENELKVKDKSDEPAPAQKEINDLAQAPPQASRARKSPEIEIEEENHERTNERVTPPRARTSAREAAFTAVCTAAGFTPSTDKQRDSARAWLATWTGDGIDLEQTILPAIRAEMAKSDPEDPTSSLKRFDRAIRHAHARLEAQPKPTSNGAVVRSLDRDDSDPRLEAIRSDLRTAIGPKRYDAWLKPIRLSVDGTTLTVECPSAFHANHVRSEFDHRIRDTAKPHNLSTVRIEAVPSE